MDSVSDAFPELRIPLTSAAEVPFARGAIEFAYTGQVQAGSVREVLEIRRQGAHLALEGLSKACTEAIKRMLLESNNSAASSSGGGGASGSTPSQLVALQLFEATDLWNGAEDDEDFAEVVSAAKPRLVQYFRDTLTLLNDPSMHQQFLTLPAVGVEGLLESDDFGTDSESSVLLLLAQWMQENHSKTDAATRKRLSRLIRMTQLTPAYLHHILPALAYEHTRKAELPASWLPVDIMEAVFIARYAVADEGAREHLRDGGAEEMWDLKSPWYASGPRRQCLSSQGRSFAWQIVKEQLKQALAGLQLAQSMRVFPVFDNGKEQIAALGFLWRPSLELTGGQDTAGLFLRCASPPAVETAQLLRSNSNALIPAVTVDARVEVHCWKGGVQVEAVSVNVNNSEDFFYPGLGRGIHDSLALRPQPAAGCRSSSGHGAARCSLASWSRYLHNGRIEGTLTFMQPSHQEPSSHQEPDSDEGVFF